MYFYIKTIPSDSYSSIAFLIRTQWTYTKWNQLAFTFLAEDRTDIETGYYQIDAGALSGCGINRKIDILLPYRTAFSQRTEIKHQLYLHGF